MLPNLVSLKDDLKLKGQSICSFIFRYKSRKYIVLVKRFVGKEKRENKYALVKLHFFLSDNISFELPVEANALGLIIDAKTLRSYFGIEYAENLGDILNQFSDCLNRFIPSKVPSNCTNKEKELLVNSLSHSDSEDPKKIFCIGLKRNPKGKFRTEYNKDKARFLNPDLFYQYENDETISFCFTDDKEKEKTNSEIMNNFAENENKNLFNRK